MVISKSALAEELGIARSGVSKMIDRGLPVRHDGQIDLLAACLWITNNVSDGGALGHARDWLRLLDRSQDLMGRVAQNRISNSNRSLPGRGCPGQGSTSLASPRRVDQHQIRKDDCGGPLLNCFDPVFPERPANPTGVGASRPTCRTFS